MKIEEIMQNEETERLFGKRGVITRKYRDTFDYDEELLKKILGKKRWLSVLKLNVASLNKVVKTLSASQKKEIEAAKKINHKTSTLRIKET